MKKLIVAIALLFSINYAFAQGDSTQQHFVDSVESELQYQQGEIKFGNGIGTLTVPAGFRYLDPKQSQYVLEDLWGNPEDTTVMGMIVPENRGILADNSWAFIITFDEMGYVEDDDADDIDYDDLLAEMQNDSKTENEQRTQAGYEPIEIVGWGSKPFYDKDKKVLHWAKELKFGTSEFNTLNYNVRILGRKGVLVLNAVSSMNELDEVQKNITPVLSSFAFADGSAYDDFNPELDEVAAWSIGGLVAGKVLAKAGILALLLKNIKLIIIGALAMATGAWKWFKRKSEPPTVRNIDESSGTSNS